MAKLKQKLGKVFWKWNDSLCAGELPFIQRKLCWLAVTNKEQCSLHTVSYNITSHGHLGFSQSLGLLLGFPGGSALKGLHPNTGEMGLVSGSGRRLGERNDNPHQYSCLGNPMDRGAWWATVRGVAKSWTWLSKWITTATRVSSWFPSPLILPTVSFLILYISL